MTTKERKSARKRIVYSVNILKAVACNNVCAHACLNNIGIHGRSMTLLLLKDEKKKKKKGGKGEKKKEKKKKGVG